jgi:hypothetical protein
VASPSSFRLGNPGDSKEGNLHAFEQTDEGHEQKEDNDSNDLWNSIPPGSLVIEESNQGHREAKAQGGE